MYNQHIKTNINRRIDVSELTRMIMAHPESCASKKEARELAIEAMQEATKSGIHKIGRVAFNMAIVEYIEHD